MSALLGVLGGALLFALFGWGALRLGAVERGGAACGGTAGGEGGCGLCAFAGTSACATRISDDAGATPVLQGAGHE